MQMFFLEYFSPLAQQSIGKVLESFLFPLPVFNNLIQEEEKNWLWWGEGRVMRSLFLPLGLEDFVETVECSMTLGSVCREPAICIEARHFARLPPDTC